MKKQTGITLIALVVTIIVLIILAGVSINLVVGDNGIITMAKKSTYEQSVVTLEEYIKMYCLEHYSLKGEKETDLIQKLKNDTDWIYTTKSGNMIIDGKIYYLFQKENLPENIKKALKGGEAGEKTYVDYYNFNDVYGITSDLKVYYYNKELGMRYGSEDEELEDNPSRIIFESNSQWAQALENVSGIVKDENGNIVAQSMKNIKKLTLDGSTYNLDLTELYNFTTLQELTLKNFNIDNLGNLDQLPVLKYLKLYNSTINNYSKVASVKDRLSYLYMEQTTNNELQKLCSTIANTDFKNLKYFGVFNSSSVTDISCLENLSDNTKKGIEYMYLYNNNLKDISAIKDYINIYELFAYQNSITNLNAIQNMNSIAYLDMNNNNITDITGLKNCKNLYSLKLSNNVNLVNVVTISNNTKLGILHLENNENMDYDQVVAIANIISQCGNQAIYPDKYKDALNQNLEVISYANQSLTCSKLEAIGNFTQCLSLNLHKITHDTSDGKTDEEWMNTLVESLSKLTNLISLRLSAISELNTISYVENMHSLRELIIDATSITDISLLETKTNDAINGKTSFKLNSLVISNVNTNLTSIQKTISRLGYISPGNDVNFYKKYTILGNWVRGLIITNANLYSKLAQCTEITNLVMWTEDWEAQNSSLDLHLCTKLDRCDIFNWDNNTIIFPPNMTWGNILTGVNVSTDFSYCKKLTTFQCGQNLFDSLENICKKLANVSTLTSFKIIQTTQVKNLEPLIYLKDSNITMFQCVNANGEAFGKLEDIEGIKYLNKLTRLDLYYNVIYDISPIANLTNLQTLNIHKNNINEISALSKLTKLTTLNLSNNNITDEQLPVLANLNKNYSLRSLYLSGNDSITSYEILKEGTWTNKDW